MSDDAKGLVARLRDILRNWTNVPDDEQVVIREAADTIERLEGAVAYWRDATEHTLDRATESLRESRDALAERCEKLREALRDATQIVEQYVAHNPTWTNGIGKTQDPMGAHALLSRMLALAAPKDGG